MENNRKIIAGVTTYLAQLGIGGGVSGLCSTMMRTAFGKTKLGRAFAFTTSVCAGVCTAFGAEKMLYNGAEYIVNVFADDAKYFKNLIEVRHEETEETQEDEAN